MGNASQHFLNLSKRFTIVRLFGTFHLLPIKILKDKQNKNEEREDNFGFRPNLSICPPLSVSSLLSSVSLLYVSATTLKKWPCCKLPCLLFDTSLTCEGKSLSTF